MQLSKTKKNIKYLNLTKDIKINQIWVKLIRQIMTHPFIGKTFTAN